MREGTRGDFDRFCQYSIHIRYLQAQDGTLPNEILEDYMRLFPDRPILPRVRSIDFLLNSTSCLPSLIGSLTPADNQSSTSPATLRRLSINRNPLYDPSEEEGESLARSLVTFQYSSRKLGGGIEVFQDFLPFPERGRYQYAPAGCKFQRSIENAFVLPPPDTVDAPVHGLRRLEVTHYLHELPAFFGRVARMHALEHLKIAIANDDRFWGTEEESDSKEPHIVLKPVSKNQSGSDRSTERPASTLEIEGRWPELSPAICKIPSEAAQFRKLRLLYYLTDLSPTEEGGALLLDLPADVIPPNYLEALTIDLLDNGEDIPNAVDTGIEGALKVDAFRPLLRYRQMSGLHLELPYNILLDLDFLRALGAVMGETLRHLVVLRRLTQWDEDDFKPLLTAEDLPTIVGDILPRLEALGLDVIYNEIAAPAKQDSSVAPPRLQALYVGTNSLNENQITEVARFLMVHFPNLRCLYHEGEEENPWSRVVTVNGYSDGKNVRRYGLDWYFQG